MGEALDPALEPILVRALSKAGGRTLIRLGDAEVDYDPAFRWVAALWQARSPLTCPRRAMRARGAPPGVQVR